MKRRRVLTGEGTKLLLYQQETSSTALTFKDLVDEDWIWRRECDNREEEKLETYKGGTLAIPPPTPWFDLSLSLYSLCFELILFVLGLEEARRGGAAAVARRKTDELACSSASGMADGGGRAEGQSRGGRRGGAGRWWRLGLIFFRSRFCCVNRLTTNHLRFGTKINTNKYNIFNELIIILF